MNVKNLFIMKCYKNKHCFFFLLILENNKFNRISDIFFSFFYSIIYRQISCISMNNNFLLLSSITPVTITMQLKLSNPHSTRDWHLWVFLFIANLLILFLLFIMDLLKKNKYIGQRYVTCLFKITLIDREKHVNQ